MTTQLPAETPVVLTGAQVAEIFQVHRRTVDRWARAGKLRSVGVGHRRYLRADIEKLLAARGEPSAASRPWPYDGAAGRARLTGNVG